MNLVDPVIQTANRLPVIAPETPVARWPDATDRRQPESHNRQNDRDFTAASGAQATAYVRASGRDPSSHALVTVDLRLSGRDDRPAAPMGPSLPFLAQSLAQEVVPEHRYQQANHRDAGTRAYEVANDRIATILGPDYPFERRV